MVRRYTLDNWDGRLSKSDSQSVSSELQGIRLEESLNCGRSFSLPDLRTDYLQTASRVWVTKDVEGPEMDGAICEEDPLVPRFEGVEDDRCETLDLPVAECPPSQIEFPVVEFFSIVPPN